MKRFTLSLQCPLTSGQILDLKQPDKTLSRSSKLFTSLVKGCARSVVKGETQLSGAGDCLSCKRTGWLHSRRQKSISWNITTPSVKLTDTEDTFIHFKLLCGIHVALFPQVITLMALEHGVCFVLSDVYDGFVKPHWVKLQWYRILQFRNHKWVLQAAFSAVFSYEICIWCLIQSWYNCFLLPGVLTFHHNTHCKSIKYYIRKKSEEPTWPCKKKKKKLRCDFLCNFILLEHLESNTVPWGPTPQAWNIYLWSLHFSLFTQWLSPTGSRPWVSVRKLCHLGLKNLENVEI